MHPLNVMPWPLSVLKWPAATVPAWAGTSAFYSITRTPDELSIVCESACIPADIQHDSGWRCLRIEAVLDFSLVGILAKLSAILAQASISIFALSTYNTDYILLKETHLEAALETLRQNGYTIING